MTTWPTAATSEVHRAGGRRAARRRRARPRRDDARRSRRHAQSRPERDRPLGARVAVVIGRSCSRAVCIASSMSTFACRRSGPRPGRRDARPRSAARRRRLRTSPRTTSSMRPGRDRAPVGQHERVAEPGRDLLDVVRDEHDRRRARLARRARRGRARASRARRGPGWRPARRAAAGPGPASARGRSRSAAARRRTASRTAWSATPPSPRSASSAARARPVRIGVVVPPRLGGGVAGGHDQVDRRQVVAELASIGAPGRRRSGADARASRPGRSARRGPRRVPAVGHSSGRRPTGAWSCPTRSAPRTTQRSPSRDRPVERAEDRPSGAPDRRSRGRR